MLSYRHGFHAGNHADVFKHTVQWLLLSHFKKKAKPFVYIDTHSGAGRYDLTSEVANKTKEYKGGVQQVVSLDCACELLKPYLDFVQQYWTQNQYPGSPEIAAQVSRDNDKLILIEKHNSEIDVLRRNYHRDPRIAVHHRDGNEALVALCPPPIKRGVVLMDPAYELKTDYQDAAVTIARAHKKWSNGTFAIWYPLLAVDKDQDAFMSDAFSSESYQSVLKVSLSVEAQKQSFGMHGSVMIIVNPPWQLDEQLETVSKELLRLLQTTDGDVSLQWLRKEDNP